MSATSKLRRRLRRKVARDEQLTPGQEQAFLRLMRVSPEATMLVDTGTESRMVPVSETVYGAAVST